MHRHDSCVADWHRLPFANGSLEQITIGHLPEFVQDDTLLLEEVTRVLQSGGTVAMTLSNTEIPGAIRGDQYVSVSSGYLPAWKTTVANTRIWLATDLSPRRYRRSFADRWLGPSSRFRRLVWGSIGRPRSSHWSAIAGSAGRPRTSRALPLRGRRSTRSIDRFAILTVVRSGRSLRENRNFDQKQNGRDFSSRPFLILLDS